MTNRACTRRDSTEMGRRGRDMVSRKKKRKATPQEQFSMGRRGLKDFLGSKRFELHIRHPNC